jgi:hypothetical protein
MRRCGRSIDKVPGLLVVSLLADSVGVLPNGERSGILGSMHCGDSQRAGRVGCRGCILPLSSYSDICRNYCAHGGYLGRGSLHATEAGAMKPRPRPCSTDVGNNEADRRMLVYHNADMATWSGEMWDVVDRKTVRPVKTG